MCLSSTALLYKTFIKQIVIQKKIGKFSIFRAIVLTENIFKTYIIRYTAICYSPLSNECPKFL